LLSNIRRKNSGEIFLHTPTQLQIQAECNLPAEREERLRDGKGSNDSKKALVFFTFFGSMVQDVSAGVAKYFMFPIFRKISPEFLHRMLLSNVLSYTCKSLHTCTFLHNAHVMCRKYGCVLSREKGMGNGPGPPGVVAVMTVQ